MLPRTRSIFRLENEREMREAREGLVGLQILIQQQHQGKGSNVVIKASMKPWKKPEEEDNLFMPSTFLKSCLLCKKELSLQKEVYMYMGDLGFCSMECRNKQILLDEKKEFDSAKRGGLGVSSLSYRSRAEVSDQKTATAIVT